MDSTAEPKPVAGRIADIRAAFSESKLPFANDFDPVRPSSTPLPCSFPAQMPRGSPMAPGSLLAPDAPLPDNATDPCLQSALRILRDNGVRPCEGQPALTETPQDGPVSSQGAPRASQSRGGGQGPVQDSLHVGATCMPKHSANVSMKPACAAGLSPIARSGQAVQAPWPRSASPDPVLCVPTARHALDHARLEHFPPCHGQQVPGAEGGVTNQPGSPGPYAWPVGHVSAPVEQAPAAGAPLVYGSLQGAHLCPVGAGVPQYMLPQHFACPAREYQSHMMQPVPLPVVYGSGTPGFQGYRCVAVAGQGLHCGAPVLNPLPALQEAPLQIPGDPPRHLAGRMGSSTTQAMDRWVGERSPAAFGAKDRCHSPSGWSWSQAHEVRDCCTNLQSPMSSGVVCVLLISQCCVAVITTFTYSSTAATIIVFVIVVVITIISIISIDISIIVIDTIIVIITITMIVVVIVIGVITMTFVVVVTTIVVITHVITFLNIIVVVVVIVITSVVVVVILVISATHILVALTRVCHKVLVGDHTLTVLFPRPLPT